MSDQKPNNSFMEENQLPENPGSAEPKGCINCGSHSVEEKYPTRLCSSCRQLFIKFPIPLGIKIFGIGVGLVLIFALFSLPKNLSVGIHLEKGKRYEAKNRYKSAQQEFASVVWQMPDNLEANEHLAIAAFYNLDFERLLRAVEKIEGKKVDDKALYFQLSNVMEKARGYYPDTALSNAFSEYEGDYSKVPDSGYVRFLQGHSDNGFAHMALARRYYERKEWAACDSLLQIVLKVDSEHMVALRMLATVQREQGLWDESIKNCEQIIKLNNEAGYAYACMSRTYLKWNKMDKGLELAKKSMAFDKDDPYNMVTMALAWHFNNQTAKRDEVLKQMKSNADTSMPGSIQYAMDVINNKESL